MIREKIRKAISHAVQGAQTRGTLPQFSVPHFSVEVPENPGHGDYATNIALVIAPLIKQNPLAIADAIAETLGGTNQELSLRVNVGVPGFINFTVADHSLLAWLTALLKNPAPWGRSDVGKGKTAVVEYFQLNIAKRPHIGHLRSAVIGDAIKRMLAACGYHAISDTHVGDWGTQFGILLLAYKERGSAAINNGDPFVMLEQLYSDENERIAHDPWRRERAKEEFVKLERGDSENRKIWEWMVDVSMQKIEESAMRLGLLPFDEHRGESSYEKIMPKVIELALGTGLAKKTPDGAVVIDLSADGLDEAVLVKSDGASTYLLRDLATIHYRKERWKFWKNLYVVDVRQSHHFRQVFRVAELLGFEGMGESEHVEFGFMTLPEGVMSTRKGTAISLDAVLDDAIQRAHAVIQEKNPDLKDAEDVAAIVGIGALKYFDLLHHRTSDIVFRWEEALSFDGNTGPYLQYTYARFKNIVRKVAGRIKFANFSQDIHLDAIEHQLLVTALKLPEATEDALADFSPSILAHYLYHLAQLANEFYHSHPVIQAKDAAKHQLRIAIVNATAVSLHHGLGFLGIAAPEEM